MNSEPLDETEEREMAKVLIVYATRTGNTRAIAELVAEGARFTGAVARVVEVKDIQGEADLEDCDALILGSPTYHGEMMPPMKTTLFMAEKAKLEGKVGGSFGAYGWSGEAIDRVYETMKNIFKMDMVSDALRLKDASLSGGTQMAQEYGKQVGKKVMEKLS
jgi:flavorubredoxin